MPRVTTGDVDAAVAAARSAAPGWAALSGTNRARMLFGVAELLDDRRDQFDTKPAAAGNVRAPREDGTVAAAVDRWFWYAGWADKVAQLAGSASPAGPGVWLSVPRPVGVVAVTEPRGSGLLGLVEALAPVLAGGNTTVLFTLPEGSGAAVSLAEVLAVSVLPAGVVTVLTGPAAVWPHLASHEDVDAADRSGAVPPDDPRRLLAFQRTTALWHTRGR